MFDEEGLEGTFVHQPSPYKNHSGHDLSKIRFGSTLKDHLFLSNTMLSKSVV